MADTFRIERREADGSSPERAGQGTEAERKQQRPAGLRLQVFTPPPFDEGPLWGTQPDAKPPEPQPSLPQPTRSARTRQMVLAGTLAAIGGLLVTVGMLISKLHGHPPAASSVASLPPVAASTDAGRAAPLSADAQVPNDAEPAPTSSSTGLASARPAARIPPPSPSAKASSGSRDASAPTAPKDAASGKKLILTDAPF